MARAVIVVLLLAAAPSVHAAGCQQFFTTGYQQTYAAQVVAAPLVYYQAGQSIEQDALAAKVAKRVIEQLRSELNAPQRPQQTAAQTVLSQACAKCHSGATPKGGLTIDGQTPLECDSILDAIQAVASGSMPKGATLTPEQKGKVLDELLLLRRQVADKPQSVNVSPPEQSGVLK